MACQFTLPNSVQELFAPFAIFEVVLMMAILTDVGDVVAVLICIFLMINKVEHLFVCLTAICMSSLEKYSGLMLVF